MRKWLVFGGIAVVVVLVALVTRHTGEVSMGNRVGVVDSPTSHSLPVPPVPANRDRSRAREEFVGSAACTPCHKAQSDAYFGSHHQKALAAPGPDTKSHFDGTHFTSKLGGTTKFSFQDGTRVVHTPALGGKTATFPI